MSRVKLDAARACERRRKRAVFSEYALSVRDSRREKTMLALIRTTRASTRCERRGRGIESAHARTNVHCLTVTSRWCWSTTERLSASSAVRCASARVQRAHQTRWCELRDDAVQNTCAASMHSGDEPGCKPSGLHSLTAASKALSCASVLLVSKKWWNLRIACVW